MPDRKHYLTYREPCLACESEGKIEHPQWEAYYEDMGKWEESNPRPDSPSAVSGSAEWWLQYDAARKAWWADAGYVHDCPPAEIDCSECGGIGELSGEVELPAEVAAKLGLAKAGEQQAKP